MLNFGCQPYSLYREDFSVHRLSYLAPYMLRMVFIARLWLAIITIRTQNVRFLGAPIRAYTSQAPQGACEN